MGYPNRVDTLISSLNATIHKRTLEENLNYYREARNANL